MMRGARHRGTPVQEPNACGGESATPRLMMLSATPRRATRRVVGLIASLLVLAGCNPVKPKATSTLGTTPVAAGVVSPTDPRQAGRDQSGTNRPVTNNGPQTPAGPSSAGNGGAPAPVIPPTTLPGTSIPLVPAGGASVGGGSSSGGGGSRGDTQPTGLLGLVSGPAAIIASNGSRIISNNGSRVISNNGSSIISNNGSAIISNNGSALLSDGGASFRLQAAVTQKGLSDAFIYLTNRDEKYYLGPDGQIFATTVDANGRYEFPEDVPAGKDVIVNAIANGNLRLVGFTIPVNEDTATVNVNVATTAAVEYLRGDAYRTDKALAAYDRTKVEAVVAQTEAAVASGAIETVRTATDQVGEAVTVGVFDLRADHTGDLRNQYVVSFSAVDAANAALKALSDAWTALLGERPTSITSTAGNGNQPQIFGDLGAGFQQLGFATGDHRGDPADYTPLAQVPLGYNYGVATSTRGDVFISAFTPKGNTGHLRWIRPNGKITSIWLPTYALGSPLGVVVEKTPTDDLNDPGTILVADAGTNLVLRVYLVDEVVPGTNVYPGAGFDGIDVERFFMEIVAGEGAPLYPTDDPYVGYLEDEHPHKLGPTEAAAYVATDGDTPQTSNWRATDEGARTYEGGGAVPKAGRYAHLDTPTDVEVDELGNVYIADKGNHRIRFIPSAAGVAANAHAFRYKTPVLDGDQEITALGAEPTQVAGAIYTIAGNPAWEPTDDRTPRGTSRWFGDYGGDDGPAQLAKLDSPYALAFNRADKCLYVADIDNNRIRKISRDTGVITTFAGAPAGAQRTNGQGDWDYAPGYLDGPAASAQFGFPRGLAFDASNRLYVADTANGLIRLVADGVVSTVAGRYHPNDGGVPTDNAGDGDARHYVDLYETEKIDVDPQGNLVFNDYRHGRLRKLWRQWD